MEEIKEEHSEEVNSTEIDANRESKTKRSQSTTAAKTSPL